MSLTPGMSLSAELPTVLPSQLKTSVRVFTWKDSMKSFFVNSPTDYQSEDNKRRDISMVTSCFVTLSFWVFIKIIQEAYCCNILVGTWVPYQPTIIIHLFIRVHRSIHLETNHPGLNYVREVKRDTVNTQQTERYVMLSREHEAIPSAMRISNRDPWIFSATWRVNVDRKWMRCSTILSNKQ